MALDSTKLVKMAGASKQIFTYETADTISTVTASGYFNNVTDWLRQFDIIMVVATTGGTPTFDNIFVTSTTGAATVTTSATEGVTAT
jgi:hypothetical protein